MTSTLEAQDASASVPTPRGTGHLNEAVRASLASLEAARRAQRQRRRRDRAVALLFTGLTVSAIWGITTQLRSADGAVAQASAPLVAPAAEVSPAIAPPPPEAVAVEALPVAEEAPPSAPDQAVPPSGGPTLAELTAACEQAGKRHNWRDVAVACGAVFSQEPNAERALTVAQALYRRSQVDEAGAWADRALALDASLPEAHILRALAAEAAGDEARAETAYRQYLTLAPRGWHAPQAKTALARLK